MHVCNDFRWDAGISSSQLDVCFVPGRFCGLLVSDVCSDHGHCMGYTESGASALLELLANVLKARKKRARDDLNGSLFGSSLHAKRKLLKIRNRRL
jgi:hypothetical protein